MKVAFVGIGNMGWPMASNLLKSGHQVIVHDRDSSRCERFAAELGGQHATSIAKLADCECVITMLPDGHSVRELYLDEGDALARHIAPGTLAIDMSSSDPSGTRDLGMALRQMSIPLIDAPVSGAVPRATTGTLAIMIGGDDPDAIERAKPVLSCMGNRLFETGPLGSGHAMKALNNFVAAAGYTAAAEALLVGRRFGLDPAKMLEVLNASTGRNFNTEVVMHEHVVERKFATGFALGLLAKDVGIAADLANALQMDAPLTQLIAERYALARERLGPTQDNSAAILAWETLRGD